MMTAFKGWKTVAFGALVAVAPALLALLGTIDWNNSGLPTWAISVIGVVIVLLRMVTNTPVGKAMAIMLCALGMALTLNACAPAAIGGGAGAAIITPVIASSLGVSTTTLSEIAAGACAAQAAANAAGAIASTNGSSAWAARFSEVSKLAGVGCAW